MAADRLEIIRNTLFRHGSLRPQELCKATGASIATIRRDLQRLEEIGTVERRHGAVRLTDGNGFEIGFKARESQNIEAKRLIAERACTTIRAGSTIFLDAGTTVLQVARMLRHEPMPLSVFTNGLAVAYELANVPELRVSVIGGQLRNENLSFVGPQAERALEDLWFDQMFIGFSAAHSDASFHTLDVQEASLNRRMLACTAHPILLADASKFGLRAPYKVAPFSADMTVVTDAEITPDWRRRLDEAGTRLVVASGEPAS